MPDPCLLIPDIHNKYYIAKRIMESRKWSRCILLGDYCDDFNEQMEDVRRTAMWLHRVVKNPDVTALFGNHDLSYAFPATLFTQCSGNTTEKNFFINSFMRGPGFNQWDALRFFTVEQGWVISHAGFHPALVGDYKADPIASLAEMQNAAEELRKALDDARWHPWLSVSRMRGGHDYFGGPFWQDWREMRPIPGMNQLMGHTPDSMPRRGQLPDGTINVCLDTHLAHYGLLQDGELTIEKTPKEWRRRPSRKGEQ